MASAQPNSLLVASHESSTPSVNASSSSPSQARASLETSPESAPLPPRPPRRRNGLQPNRRPRPEDPSITQHTAVPGQDASSRRQSGDEAPTQSFTSTTLAAQPTATAQSPPPPASENNDGFLQTLWDAIVKERAVEVAIVALIVGIVVVGPTFGSWATGVWSDAKDYQAWCQSQQVRPPRPLLPDRS
jgi:hypothetical protein